MIIASFTAFLAWIRVSFFVLVTPKWAVLFKRAVPTSPSLPLSLSHPAPLPVAEPWTWHRNSQLHRLCPVGAGGHSALESVGGKSSQTLNALPILTLLSAFSTSSVCQENGRHHSENTLYGVTAGLVPVLLNLAGVVPLTPVTVVNRAKKKKKRQANIW